ncbi:hypothetical protein BH23GEM4_BH23GEM4_22220 [soil metagenome]
MTAPSPAAARELEVAGEIAHAFLTADGPAEVYRLALERLTPLVGAAFGCVFLEDAEDRELLRVVAAYNWPQRYAEHLGSLRVRVGNGPTGKAVADGKVIEAPDIFADPSLEEWYEPARELGFVSAVAAPLTIDGKAAGSITFYFAAPAEADETDRHLIRLVADQLSATAEKAHLIEDLERAKSRLERQNEQLELRVSEAEEARRLKSEFLSNVSHELRTPLTAVLGYAYLLQEGLSSGLSEEQRATVEKLESSAIALMGRINDLLDLSKLRQGATSPQYEACDAVGLARAALAVHPPLASGVVLSTDFPDRALPVRTDPGAAVRILRSLLDNAIKFTAQGSIRFSLTETEGDRLLWTVEDTGIGVAPEECERVFDEFRQGDGSTTRQYGGAGLGLALARGLARRLGGDIAVRSQVGVGSAFALRLPADPGGNA